MLKFLGFCTGSREGLQFKNKQNNLASAAEAAQTEGEQSISSFNVYGSLTAAIKLFFFSQKTPLFDF
jgi:hypothetical protein